MHATKSNSKFQSLQSLAQNLSTKATKKFTNQTPHLHSKTSRPSDTFIQVCHKHFDMARKAWKLPRQLAGCVAGLITMFKRWGKWKEATHRTGWVYMALRKIQDELMFVSIHTIRAAIELLIGLGVLERRNNPGNGQDRTYQYRLVCDRLEQIEAEILTGHSFVNPESPTFSPESPTFTVEQSPHNQFTRIIPTTTVVAECEFEEEEKSSERGRGLTSISHVAAEVSREDSPAKEDLGEGKCSAPADISILEEVEALGIRINLQLQKMVLNTSVGIVKDAIAFVKERMAKGGVENAAGLLTKAIREKLKPSASPSVGTPGYGAWFSRNKAAKRVAYGELIDGVQMVYLEPSLRRVTWEEAKLLFPDV